MLKTFPLSEQESRTTLYYPKDSKITLPWRLLLENVCVCVYMSLLLCGELCVPPFKETMECIFCFLFFLLFPFMNLDPFMPPAKARG